MAHATIRLSQIPRDPVVAAFLARGEAEGGQFAVAAGRCPTLSGGEAAACEAIEKAPYRYACAEASSCSR